MSSHLSLNRGISLLELLIGMALMAGFLLVGLQRQENNLISRRKQMSRESAENFKNMMQSWLQQSWTMETTLTNTTAVPLAAAPTNPLDREGAVTADDNDPIIMGANANMLERFSLRNPADPGNPTIILNQGVFNPGTTNQVRLIGYRDPGPPESIRSIDEFGQVYIRSMWVQDFVASGELTKDTGGDADNTTTSDLSKGSANLKIIIWKYTGETDTSELNCLRYFNCEREVITFPVSLTLVTASREGLTPNTPPPDPLEAGEPLITCDPETVIISGQDHACETNEFFTIMRALYYHSSNPSCHNLFGGVHPPVSTNACTVGRCCIVERQ